MKKSLVIVAGLCALLTACADMRTLYTEDQPRTKGYSLAFVTVPNPTAPNILIVDGKWIVVDQEPIRPPGYQQGDPITIYFALPEGGDYVFPDHGIEIKQHGEFCKAVMGSRYVFKCQYRRPVPDTVYHYVIRVRNERTGTNLRDLDPTIWN